MDGDYGLVVSCFEGFDKVTVLKRRNNGDNMSPLMDVRG
jgi:hypothetical protein